MSVVFVESCLNIEQIKNNKKLIHIEETEFRFRTYQYEKLNKKYLNHYNMYKYNGKLKDIEKFTQTLKVRFPAINKDKLNDESNIYIYVKDEFYNDVKEEYKYCYEEIRVYNIYISNSLYDYDGKRYFCYNHDEEDDTIIKIKESTYDFSKLKSNSNGNYNIKLTDLNEIYINWYYQYIKRRYGGEYKIIDILFINERHGGMYTAGGILNYNCTKIQKNYFQDDDININTLLQYIKDGSYFNVRLDIKIIKDDCTKKLYFIAHNINIITISPNVYDDD